MLKNLSLSPVSDVIFRTLVFSVFVMLMKTLSEIPSFRMRADPHPNGLGMLNSVYCQERKKGVVN